MGNRFSVDEAAVSREFALSWQAKQKRVSIPGSKPALWFYLSATIVAAAGLGVGAARLGAANSVVFFHENLLWD
jgi:hypothetical protein